MTENRRSPTADVIDVFISVDVPNLRAPSERATKNGSPPTLRNARTGELTPPGMRSLCARETALMIESSRKITVQTLNAQRSTLKSEKFAVTLSTLRRYVDAICGRALDTSAATTILFALAQIGGVAKW